VTLVSLTQQLQQHGVRLDLTPEGRIRPHAEHAPPAELVDAIREHRALLVRRLERGQGPDGRYDLARLVPLPGICASCSRWSPAAEWGTLMGTCSLTAAAFEEGRPLALHAAHRCAAYAGKGWTGRS
jgi:hypothetical protein